MIEEEESASNDERIIAIVGSKSLDGMQDVYEMIEGIIRKEMTMMEEGNEPGGADNNQEQNVVGRRGVDIDSRSIEAGCAPASSQKRLVILNGGEEGVDSMAGEVATSLGLEYRIVPLEECRSENCASGIQEKKKKYCFEHSYRPRSRSIASMAQKIYRIYDEGCGTSTCEVTARFGDELGKKVVRIPVDILAISR
jgi:hypothetical protein